MVHARVPAPQVSFKLCQPSGEALRGICVKLDDQDSARVALQEIAQPGRFGIELGRIQDVSVHHLDRGRGMRQNSRHCRKRFQELGELHDKKCLRPRQVDEPQPGLGHDAERSLRADE